jgi:hypothetical protein
MQECFIGLDRKRMFPIKRIEKIHQELNYYYLQVIAFQNENSQNQLNSQESIRIR